MPHLGEPDWAMVRRQVPAYRPTMPSTPFVATLRCGLHATRWSGLNARIIAVASWVALAGAPVSAQDTVAPIAPPPVLSPATLPAPMAAEKWADSARVAIEAAVVDANPDAMAAARAIAERGLAPYPDDPILLHYVGYALLREGVMRGDAEPQRSRALFLQARTTLERSAMGRDLPETHGLLSAVIANLIGGSSWRALSLGPACMRQIDRALAMGPGNPRAWLMRGVGAFYAPRFLGGGNEKAEAALKKALALFPEDHPASPLPAWGHAEAYGWLALVYVDMKRPADARQALARGLELDPRHAFLLQRVLPNVERLEVAAR